MPCGVHSKVRSCQVTTARTTTPREQLEQGWRASFSDVGSTRYRWLLPANPVHSDCAVWSSRCPPAEGTVAASRTRDKADCNFTQPLVGNREQRLLPVVDRLGEVYPPCRERP